MRVENQRLRAARERTASPRHPGECLTRHELAAQVNMYLWERHQQQAEIDDNYVAKLERGTIRWPNARYREAFRAVLKVPADEDLGFVNPRRVATPLTTDDSDSAVATDAEPAPVPRQLPTPPRRFTGRATELAALDGAGTTAVISASGGVGKTWLALHWAHERLDRFPDGQLFVNLRGFDPAGEPATAEQALRGFLVALGVHPAAIPAGQDAQAGLYRSLMAGRQMLVMLDNAADTSQVSPLLPGSPTSTVLITSRRRLTGLVTTVDAHPLDLDVLLDGEARELLAKRLGEPRLDAEPQAVTDILRYCAGLPLALGIISARAATLPDLPLSALVTELRAHRLDALDTGETDLNLRAVFSTSYDALTPEAAALFGRLGLAPGPDIGLHAAASLAGSPVQPLLRQLEDAHLVQQHRPGRYRMHDLIRLYAQELGSPGQELVDHYIATASAGSRLLYPYREPPWPIPPSDLLSGEAEALAWFDDEHEVLLAAQHFAAQQGWDLAVILLAWSLNAYHRRRGHIHEDITVWQAGLAAADRLADPAAQAWAHRFLAHAYTRLGVNKEDVAITHLREGSGNPAISADKERMIQGLTEELHHYRQRQDPAWEADALAVLGWMCARAGRYDEAHEHCQAALDLYLDHHDRAGQAAVLDSLGYIAYHSSPDPADALTYYHEALMLRREIGDTYNEADILHRLAAIHAVTGDLDAAETARRQAQSLFERQHRTPGAEVWF